MTRQNEALELKIEDLETVTGGDAAAGLGERMMVGALVGGTIGGTNPLYWYGLTHGAKMG
jgi:hypothetical protein